MRFLFSFAYLVPLIFSDISALAQDQSVGNTSHKFEQQIESWLGPQMDKYPASSPWWRFYYYSIAVARSVDNGEQTEASAMNSIEAKRLEINKQLASLTGAEKKGDVYLCNEGTPQAEFRNSGSVVGCRLVKAPIVLPGNWVQIGDGDSTDAYVDVQSVASKGIYKKAWFTINQGSPQKTNYGDKAFLSAKQLVYFNCSERTIELVQTVSYSDPNGGGDVVSSQNQTFQPLRLIDVVPGTLGELMLNFVCKQNAKAKSIPAGKIR